MNDTNFVKVYRGKANQTSILKELKYSPTTIFTAVVEPHSLSLLGQIGISMDETRSISCQVRDKLVHTRIDKG